MKYRSLIINVISAKYLRKVNLISKTRAYAVVSISGDPKASQQQRTAVDRAGNGNPTWNFPVRFAVDEADARSNRLAVTFRILCERSLGDKDIGVVHVPLSELIGSLGDGKSQFVSYQVRERSGKAKGKLNFSYKWGDKTVGAPAMEANRSQQPITAYPAQVGSSSAYPSTGYPYQAPLPGYGYPPPQPGYGYPPVQQPQQPQRNSRFGLGTGLLGGMMFGDMIGGHGGGWRGGGCGGGGRW